MITEVAVANTLPIYTINEITDYNYAGPILLFQEKFFELFRWMKMAMGALTLRSFLQWCRTRYIAHFDSYQTNVDLWEKRCFLGQTFFFGTNVVLWDDMLFFGTICDSKFMVWLVLYFSWRWKKMRSMRTFGRRSEFLIGMETGIFIFEVLSEKICG